jgi:hypothetical protein
VMTIKRSRALLVAVGIAALVLPIWVGAVHTFEPSWDINVIEVSNVRVLVTDPQGRCTGWDSVAGAEMKEIPRSNYLDERSGPVDRPMFVAYLETPPAGLYRLEVIGTVAGAFSMEIGISPWVGRR